MKICLWLVLLVAICLPVVAGGTQGEATVETGPKKLIIWSHFANEPSTREFIELLIEDFENDNPAVDVEITWFDKNPLRDTVKTTMAAGGTGAPDITTFDSDQTEWIEAGWVEDLSDVIDFDKLVAGCEKDATYPDLGYPGHYKFPLNTVIDYILYNKKAFAEAGVTVPGDFTFSQNEFLDVVKKCKSAGYWGHAGAIGNRPYPGWYVSEVLLISKIGDPAFEQYMKGQRSWDTAEIREVLSYLEQLRDAGMFHDQFATMNVDEYHVYFHTQRKAAMLINGDWYTGRAFKPVEEGGQDPNWQFGMLRYPEMKGGKGAGLIGGAISTGYTVLSTSENKELAKDFLRYWQDRPKYGAIFMALRNSSPAIKYTEADTPDWVRQMENPFAWYQAEVNRVYGTQKVIYNYRAGEGACGNFRDAIVSTLNQGLPLKLISVDDAIKLLDANLCR